MQERGPSSSIQYHHHLLLPCPTFVDTKLVVSFFVLLLLLADAIIEYNPRGYINMNAIGRCWRRDPGWAKRRTDITICSVGFAGRMTPNKGRNMTFYEVTDSSDHPTETRKGTLRYGATMIPGVVWITFKYDMVIKLRYPLMVSSFTTIDGRGAKVHIANGAGFLLYQVRDVIIHGLHFHDIKYTINNKRNWLVIRGGERGDLGKPEGSDAIRLVAAKNIWIDHNTLYRAHDGLIDAQSGSTGITISNNWFKKHDKVMLLGGDDKDNIDHDMRVTVVYNHFRPSCNQRMPRIRNGYVHVANNLYEGWRDSAIGGSMHPAILSEGNRFIAKKDNPLVMWRKTGGGWHVRSKGDLFFEGARFQVTDPDDTTKTHYGPLQRFPAASAANVMLLTKDAGALSCRAGTLC